MRTLTALVAGLALAIATLLGTSLMWDSRDAPVGAQYLPQLISAPWHYAWLILVPVSLKSKRCAISRRA